MAESFSVESRPIQPEAFMVSIRIWHRRIKLNVKKNVNMENALRYLYLREHTEAERK